jgi:hypothetical protein
VFLFTSIKEIDYAATFTRAAIQFALADADSPWGETLLLIRKIPVHLK